MPDVAIQIVRFVDDNQPGFVECVLVDSLGNLHTFIEKVPVVTTAPLWSESVYPQRGAIACEVVATWIDEMGRSFARIDTSRPWGIESTTGETSFVVFASQLA